MLADEVSPDTCRLWDATTNEKLDKDRFRRDLGKVRKAYEEILARLEKNHRPKMMGRSATANCMRSGFSASTGCRTPRPLTHYGLHAPAAPRAGGLPASSLWMRGTPFRHIKGQGLVTEVFNGRNWLP